MKTIRSLGWDWTTDGAIVTVMVDDALLQWFIPLAHVQLRFGEELARVGCPLRQTVSGPPSVGGFFDSVAHAYKSATRAVKKAVPKALSKAASSVTRAAERGARTLSRQVKSYGRDVARVAANTVRDPRQLGLAALTGGASLAAQTRLQRDALALGRHLPGPIGSAATALQSADAALRSVASGKRVDVGRLASGLAQAGAAYVPGGGALGRAAPAALRAGAAMAQGQSVDRALKSALLNEVSHLRGLPLPSTPALAEAARAWQHVASRAPQAGRTLSALRRTVAQAQQGDRRARDLVSAFQRVGACI